MRVLVMEDGAASAGVAVAQLRPVAGANVTPVAGWATLSPTMLTGGALPSSSTSYILRVITTASERVEIGAWATLAEANTDAPLSGTSALSIARAHILGSDRVEDYRFIASDVIRFRNAA